MSVILFRRASEHDAVAIVGLVNSAFRGESSKQGWTTEAELLGGQRTDQERVEALVREPRGQILLCLDPNPGSEGAQTLQGCAYLRFAEADGVLGANRRQSYVGMITVRPDAQSRGVGRALLQQVEDLSRETGHAAIRMTVIDRRPELIAYYERRGYRKTGESEPFPEDDPRFGLPKVKGMRLLEMIKNLTLA